MKTKSKIHILIQAWPMGGQPKPPCHSNKILTKPRQSSEPGPPFDKFLDF